MENSPLLAVDRATEFTQEELDTLKNQYHVKAIGFYLGGPYYSIDGWTVEGFDRARNSGFHMLPYYIGQNAVKGSKPPVFTVQQAIADANDAVRRLDEFGFSDPKGICVALDVERSSYNYSPDDSTLYADEWCNTLHIHGSTPGVYGALETFDKMISTNRAPGFIVLASWVANGFDSRLSLADMPGLPNSQFTNYQRCWQYAGNVALNGIADRVDIGLFDSSKCIAPTGNKDELEPDVPAAAVETSTETVDVKTQLMTISQQLNTIAQSM